MLQDPTLLQKIVLTLALGSLIGIERESRSGKHELVYGVRTFSLISLFGLISGYFSFTLHTPWFAIVGLATTFAISICGYLVKVKLAKRIGMTTAVAFIITFLLGLVCYYDTYPYFFTVTLGILTGFILVVKEYSRKFTRMVLVKEVRSAIIFALLTFIILPVLPDYPVDPLGLFNPHLVWLMVVFILGISFLSYVGMRLYGAKRGIGLAGLFGGFISSTAVSSSMAVKVKKNKKLLKEASFAVLIASSTMFLRSLIVGWVVNSNVGITLLVPQTTMALIGYGLALSLWKGVESRGKVEVEIGSPLDISPAIKFGAFFAIILAASKLSSIYLGHRGVYITSMIAGISDVDAITVSMATMGGVDIPIRVARNAIIIACLTNTVVKWFIVRTFGSKEMGKLVGKVFLTVMAVGSLLIFLL